MLKRGKQDMMMTNNNERAYRVERATARELLVFLYDDMNMTPKRWRNFIYRYANRNTASVIRYLNEYSGVKITSIIKDFVEEALREELEKLQKKR